MHCVNPLTVGTRREMISVSHFAVYNELWSPEEVRSLLASQSKLARFSLAQFSLVSILFLEYTYL